MRVGLSGRRWPAVTAAWGAKTGAWGCGCRRASRWSAAAGREAAAGAGTRSAVKVSVLTVHGGPFL